MVHRPAHVQYTAERNGLRGGGRRPRPHLEPRGVYFFLVLLDGRGGRARVPEVRACAPHPPSRARSDHTHTCRRYRTLATPSASLARPLRPSLDHDAMPRAAQRTARVARPFIGPPSSLAARPAATSKVAMDGAANELLGPKGRREIAHAHPLPPSAGANAARGHALPPTPPTRCRPPPISPPHAPPSPPLPSPLF